MNEREPTSAGQSKMPAATMKAPCAVVIVSLSLCSTGQPCSSAAAILRSHHDQTKYVLPSMPLLL